jgi:hypothetical protein
MERTVDLRIRPRARKKPSNSLSSLNAVVLVEHDLGVKTFKWPHPGRTPLMGGY